jgi:hypothetical protein
VLNISHTTVVRDQHDSGGTNVPTRIGTDGKTYRRVPDVVEGVVLPSEAEEDAEKIRRANVSSARQYSERLANEMRAVVADLQLKSGNLADHLELIGSGMPELISLTETIENGRRRLDAPLQGLGDATAEFGKVIKKAIKEANP